MSREETLRSVAANVFGKMNGMGVRGLNGEQEIFESLMANILYIDSQMQTPIDIDSLQLDEKNRYIQYATEINEILGKEIFKTSGTVRPSDLYIARVYENLSGGPGVICSVRDLEPYTFNADIIRRRSNGDIGRLRLEALTPNNRAGEYPEYAYLSEADKKSFRQEMRKKVFSHEFNHLSITETSGSSLDCMELEEIAVERMALKANGLARIVTVDRCGGKYTQKLPNRESSRSAIYASGEILSLILGEENFQVARMTGKLDELIQRELGMTAKELNRMLYCCRDKEGAKRKGYGDVFEAQIETEQMLLEKYAQKVLNQLQKQDQCVNYDDMEQIYNELGHLYKLILKKSDPAARENMESVKILKSLLARCDSLLDSYHIDSDAFKEAVKERSAVKNPHYINEADKKVALANRRKQ